MGIFREIVLKNRSYRRFEESHFIPKETLEDLVGLARCTPSAGNLQPAKYILSSEPTMNARIFPCLGWAGYLTDWPGPAPGERPSAYVVLLIDETITEDKWGDYGIAAQTIMLGAVEKGLGGCMIGSIQREKLQSELEIPEHLKIRLVLAIGKPVETVVIEDMKPGGSVHYWRDEKKIHHVPKRMLSELIIK